MGRSKITNGRRMLDNIDGRTLIGRRLRDIVNGLLIEFPVTDMADLILIKDTAGLAVVSEQLQAQVVRGEMLPVKEISNLAGQLRRNLADLRQRTDQRGSPPPSIHQHLAEYDHLLGQDVDDDVAIDEGGD